jgi:transcriptional regulator with GAF, ATPase, and Fis domain
LGVHSVLSLPLISDGAVLGVMNVYAHPKDAFTDHAEHTGQEFAASAAVTVQNAHTLAETRHLTVHLHRAMTTRGVIDQAIGILISCTGDTPEKAFDRIRSRSQTTNTKVTEIAAGIIDEAVRRARRRDGQ